MTDPLTKIGQSVGTDKAGFHGYTKYYHEILSKYRNRKLFFLELGFGGYEWPDAGGESVRMWAQYAPKWDIAVVDIYEKYSYLYPYSVDFYQGSQDDPKLMLDIVDQHGYPTIVVDDASHMSPLTINSFHILWPLLKSGGVYIIEDIGTSYFYEYGGDPFGNTGSAVSELGKSMIDNIMANSPHGKQNGIMPWHPDLGVDMMWVLPNAVALRKK